MKKLRKLWASIHKPISLPFICFLPFFSSFSCSELFPDQRGRSLRVCLKSMGPFGYFTFVSGGVSSGRKSRLTTFLSPAAKIIHGSAYFIHPSDLEKNLETSFSILPETYIQVYRLYLCVSAWGSRNLPGVRNRISGNGQIVYSHSTAPALSPFAHA